MPLVSSLSNSRLPIAPVRHLAERRLVGQDVGKIEHLELPPPSGPNLASEGASICTAPNCSASTSSLSL